MSGDKYFISDQHAPYFVTCTVVHWIDVFTRPVYRDVLVDSLNYCATEKHVQLFAWVIMSKHIHLVFRCDAPGGASAFLRDFKKFTSKKILELIGQSPESRKEWLLDKFGFEARRSGRAENYKLWKDGNHAIDLTNIDMMEKI